MDFNEISYTIYCLNIIYCHTYYDVCTLPYVLSVMSLWCQSLRTAWDELDQCIIDKAIKQWRTLLRAYVEAKGGRFENKLYRLVRNDRLHKCFTFCKNLSSINDFTSTIL